MAIRPAGSVLDRFWSVGGRPVATDESLGRADDWSGGTPRIVNAAIVTDAGEEISREAFDALVASSRDAAS